MEKAPYMPFYGKDFYDDSKVKVLSLGAQGLYVALLWRQWVDGAIPTSFSNMAKLIGQDVKDVKRYWPEVAPFFGSGLNDKLEKVRAALLAKRLAQQKGAATTNANRSLRPSLSAPHPSVSQMPAIAIANANANGSTEGEREGKPKIGYAQFLYFSGQAAKWHQENKDLYIGGDGESYDRAFRNGVGIDRAELESLKAYFEFAKGVQ